MVLEPVYETDFRDVSHGFRPGRGAHGALESLWKQLMSLGGGWVVDVDLRRFFETIDHGHLREILRRRVRDGVILRLIGKWLNAGVLEAGVLTTPEQGTPQGGVISPLLANLVLHHVLDEWFAREVQPRLMGQAFLIRYADDFVIGVSREDDAWRIMDVLPKRMGKYGLAVHPEKTRLVRFRPAESSGSESEGSDLRPPTTSDFLGFTHFWGRSRAGRAVVQRRTAKSRLRRTLSAAPASTSGAPAPSTRTPPAAPTGPPPSGPATGSASGRCPQATAGPPGLCRPPAGSTSARRNCRPGAADVFRTKCESAVELPREQARTAGQPHPGVLDGGYARKNVVRPLVVLEGEAPRVESLTRLRQDARLHRRPATARREGQRGPTPKWGRKPLPCQGGRWPGGWRKGEASIYGRMRTVRWKEVVCHWWVLGSDVPVKAVVACVEGYKKRFTVVGSALVLSGLQMAELFRARLFRQGNGSRGLERRLGREECQAWTRASIERTTRVPWATMSPLRLLQFRLDAEKVPDWWPAPPWDRKKGRPSIPDVERLPRSHRAEIQQLLPDWLGSEERAA